MDRSRYPNAHSNYNIVRNNLFYNSGGTSDCAIMVLLNSNYNIFEDNIIHETLDSSLR